MATTEKVLDEHLGMIDRQTASKIAEGKSIAEQRPSNDPLDIASEMVTIADLAAGKVRLNSLVEIEEVVYKVYSKRLVEVGGVDIMTRLISLGTRENRIRLILFDGKVDLANSIPIERGDRIVARNFVVRKGVHGFELASIAQSTIGREMSANTGITEFSRIKPDAQEIDVLGKLVVIGPIKHSIFAVARDNDSCSFTISDGIDQMKVFVVGNNVRELESAHPGDPIKLEYATVRKNGGVELYLNESSRILVSGSLKGRLRV
ncbi:MAG: hypothetical protein KGH71_01295 [Candidatus Micrarchaeota archaeon]|nr:hypothetical protein [Candidatus Micrarchaeota archaeon]